MTNPTPVEYCRHENCGKREVVVCACNPSCTLSGYVHVDTGLHYCSAGDCTFAEPADPPQQQTRTVVIMDLEPKLKAGTQMEDVRGQALWEAAQAICIRCATDGRPKDGGVEVYSGEVRGYLHYYDNGEVSECEADKIHEMIAKIPKTQMEERNYAEQSFGREYLKASEWLVKTGKVEKMTPTREQIAEMLSRFVYDYKLEDIADALLREYEIRVKEEKNG